MATRQLVNCPPWIRIVEANVAKGTPYWRLSRVEYWDDQRSGGTHHIYVQEPHDPSVRVVVSNGQENWPVPLEKPQNEPAGNFPMFGNNLYSATLEGLPGDRIEGMHMPSKHHVSYLLWFERATRGDTDDHVPPPPPPAASLRAALLREGEARQLLQFNPNAAIQKVIFREGFVPNSPEFELTHGGITYVAQRAERLGDGRVRLFYVRQGEWDNVRWEERNP